MASIVYLGEHYIVDALDGLIYVAVATVAVEGFMRWRQKRIDEAPTPARLSA
jgi:membrane-associated phospholipid phosphatase